MTRGKKEGRAEVGTTGASQSVHADFAECTLSDQPDDNLGDVEEVCKYGVRQPCILGYPGCICADEALLEDLQEDS